MEKEFKEDLKEEDGAMREAIFGRGSGWYRDPMLGKNGRWMCPHCPCRRGFYSKQHLQMHFRRWHRTRCQADTTRSDFDLAVRGPSQAASRHVPGLGM